MCDVRRNREAKVGSFKAKDVDALNHRSFAQDCTSCRQAQKKQQQEAQGPGEHMGACDQRLDFY